MLMSQDKLMNESKVGPHLVTGVRTTVRFRILPVTVFDSSVALWIEICSVQGGVAIRRDPNTLRGESSGCLQARTLHRPQTLWGTKGRTKNTAGRGGTSREAGALGNSCSGPTLSLRIPGELSSWWEAPHIGGVVSQSTLGNAVRTYM